MHGVGIGVLCGLDNEKTKEEFDWGNDTEYWWNIYGVNHKVNQICNGKINN